MVMQLFGREAMEILDYVECFPNGAGKGKKMANECVATGLEGFPTWVINGKVLPITWMFPLKFKSMMSPIQRFMLRHDSSSRCTSAFLSVLGAHWICSLSSDDILCFTSQLHASSFSFPHMMLSVTTLRRGLPMLPKMMKALCFLCVHELIMYLSFPQLLSGDQELSVLAEESGFVSESPEQSWGHGALRAEAPRRIEEQKSRAL